MSVRQIITQKQGQTLALTPQLRQAIKLLELTNIELGEFLQVVVAENPLLICDDSNRSISLDDGKSSHGAAESDFSNMWTGNGVRESENDGESFAERIADKAISLREFLRQQLNSTFSDSKSLIIGAYLIDNIDDTGYFTVPISKVTADLGGDENEIDEILQVMQKFEPTGVFSRSLAECLKIQMHERRRLDPIAERFLNNLDLFAQGKIEHLVKVCLTDRETLAEIMAEIRTLDPKPGLKFCHEELGVVIPEATIRQDGDSWVVHLNAGALPRILLDQSYYAEVSKSSGHDKDAKLYINERYQAANHLIKALDQRAKTILKVCQGIVESQRQFFAHGVRYLKPMILKDIAEKIDVHESTVSRITNGKYISTPRGIFELKYFFNSAISTNLGGTLETSSESVRQRIKEIIEEEKTESPMSDEDLMHELSAEGIKIARRTIAKYRESLGIATSFQRKQAAKRIIA